MLTDYHLHSTFSLDGRQDLDALCRSALEKGLTHIALTDHIDLAPNYRRIVFNITDATEYREAIDAARARFPQLSITRGVELGYDPNFWAASLERVEAIQPEFILGSLHYIDQIDPAEEPYFQTHSQVEGYNVYLERLAAYIPVIGKTAHVLAHLDYVTKFCPFEDPELRYEDYADRVDACLKALLASGMALEINTSGYRKRTAPLPGPSILKRYYELGGRRISFGSDAHYPEFVAYDFPRAHALARSIGFTHVSYWVKGQEERYRLE